MQDLSSFTAPATIAPERNNNPPKSQNLKVDFTLNSTEAAVFSQFVAPSENHDVNNKNSDRRNTADSRRSRIGRPDGKDRKSTNRSPAMECSHSKSTLLLPLLPTTQNLPLTHPISPFTIQTQAPPLTCIPKEIQQTPIPSSPRPTVLPPRR